MYEKLKVAQEQSCLLSSSRKSDFIDVMYRVTKSEEEGTVQNYSLRKKQSQKEEGWRKGEFPHKKDFQFLI